MRGLTTPVPYRFPALIGKSMLTFGLKDFPKKLNKLNRYTLDESIPEPQSARREKGKGGA